jgi:site-specific DNA recombinase
MENIIYRNKNAVAILRVSSTKQTDGGISHQVQEERCREYCEKMGLILVEQFVITESAKDSQERKKYHNAMDFVKKRKIGNVVFYMADREGRNLTDIEENEYRFLRGDFNLHIANDGKIYHQSTSTSELLARNIQAVLARNNSQVTREKVIEAMAAKAKSGWYPSNNPPLGYVTVKVTDPETGRTKNRGTTIGLAPNKNNIKVVLREFELRAKGFSYDEIRNSILSEGLLTAKKALTYRKSSIENRLKNPFYRGEFDWKGKLYKGNHELFVPKAWMEKVDKMNGLRGCTKRHFADEHMAMVDGWLKCSCGCRVIYDPKTKKIKDSGETKTYHYYHCTNGKKAHEKLENIQGEKIWEQFGGLMEKINISEEFAKDIADALNKTEKKAHRVVELQIAEFNDKLKELDSRKDSLVDLMLSKQIEKELFDQQLKRINSNRDSLVDQLEAHQKSLTSALIETAKTVLELATSAKSLWISKSPQERRELLDLILSNPILDGLTVRFELKKPFAVLVGMKENVEWCTRQDSNFLCLHSSEVSSTPSYKSKLSPQLYVKPVAMII